MTRRTLLVTGGAGFIGSAVVRRLVHEGHSVRVLDNQSRGSGKRLDDLLGDVEFIRADIRDAGAVERAVRGTDSVCHLAYVNGTEFFYSQPELVLDVGIKGMINVVDACVKQGVRELVLVSSSEVYQAAPMIPTPESVPLVIPDLLNPRYSYAAGKITSEVMAVHYGRKHFERVVIVRPHNVYGPDMGWEHVVPQLLMRVMTLRSSSLEPLQLAVHGSGQETRAFTYIDDFVDGFVRVIEHARGIDVFHVGTEEEVTIASLAGLIGEYFGRKVVVTPGPPAAGSVLRRCPDTAKIAALGFIPRYSLREGLQITARWYEDHAYVAARDAAMPSQVGGVNVE